MFPIDLIYEICKNMSSFQICTMRLLNKSIKNKIEEIYLDKIKIKFPKYVSANISSFIKYVRLESLTGYCVVYQDGGIHAMDFYTENRQPTKILKGIISLYGYSRYFSAGITIDGDYFCCDVHGNSGACNADSTGLYLNIINVNGNYDNLTLTSIDNKVYNFKEVNRIEKTNGACESLDTKEVKDIVSAIKYPNTTVMVSYPKEFNPDYFLIILTRNKQVHVLNGKCDIITNVEKLYWYDNSRLDNYICVVTTDNKKYKLRREKEINFIWEIIWVH